MISNVSQVIAPAGSLEIRRRRLPSLRSQAASGIIASGENVHEHAEIMAQRPRCCIDECLVQIHRHHENIIAQSVCFRIKPWCK